jgi:pyrrolidone-carboxylate peptidase
MDREPAGHRTSEQLRAPSHPSRAGPAAANGPAASFWRLQRAVGNRAFGTLVQTKLRVNAPGDRFEAEADRVAEWVVRAPAAARETVAVERGTDPAVQCACAGCKSGHPCTECAHDDDEESLQRAATSTTAVEVTPAMDAEIAALRDGGRPLSPPERAFFEPRFGQDFGAVRVHSGAGASRAAEALRARAFTVGHDIVFGDGEYAPGTDDGRRLLAHELTHTIQQGALETRVVMRREKPPQETDECTDVGTKRWIKHILVNQDSGAGKQQSVTLTWSDGASQKGIVSTGKGHCCIDPALGAADAACPPGSGAKGGSNCTPTETSRTVKRRPRKSSSGVEFWTEIDSAREIALHRYDENPDQVTGQPLSHGCVRMEKDLARIIWCGSREGKTIVELKGLPRPQCDDRNVQREWLKDFREAGTKPPDGETNTVVRGALRRALGVSDEDLTSRLSALETEIGGFPTTINQKTKIPTVAVALIPRCLPTQTEEEALLGGAGGAKPAATPKSILEATKFAGWLPAFETLFSKTTSLVEARKVARAQGRALWVSATKLAQGKARSAEDRALYWTRLGMARTIRQTAPAWVRDLNPDDARRAKAELLDLFELASRGMDTATFAAKLPAGRKRILISGFDPFALQSSIATGNPSGAAVLALDGRTLTGEGRSASVQGVIFPVRFADFNAGMVESFFRPFLKSVDMIMTISMGGIAGVFEVEEFAGRRRSSEAEDNLRRTGGGTEQAPIVPPGVGGGEEFLPTTLPRAEIRGALGRRAPLEAETEVVEIPAGEKKPTPQRTGPTKGSVAAKGSGGGYLSNEIFYRTALLRKDTGATVPLGHLHTPFLDPGTTDPRDPKYAQARDKIVATVEKILIATLPAL